MVNFMAVLLLRTDIMVRPSMLHTAFILYNDGSMTISIQLLLLL